jgi:hypothetical protein
VRGNESTLGAPPTAAGASGSTSEEHTGRCSTVAHMQDVDVASMHKGTRDDAKRLGLKAASVPPGASTHSRAYVPRL